MLRTRDRGIEHIGLAGYKTVAAVAQVPARAAGGQPRRRGRARRVAGDAAAPGRRRPQPHPDRPDAEGAAPRAGHPRDVRLLRPLLGRQLPPAVPQHGRGRRRASPSRATAASRWRCARARAASWPCRTSGGGSGPAAGWSDRGHQLTVVVEPIEPPELFDFFVEFRESLGMNIVVPRPGLGVGDREGPARQPRGVPAVRPRHPGRRHRGGVLRRDDHDAGRSGHARASARGAPILPTGVYFTNRRNGHLADIRRALPIERTRPLARRHRAQSPRT